MAKNIPTIEEVFETASKSKRKLAAAVVEQFGDWATLYECPEDYRDASAGVSGFTYYDDTHKFARENIEEIMDVLAETERECGPILPQECDDRLNWFAWFALESIVQDIIDFKENQDD